MWRGAFIIFPAEQLVINQITLPTVENVRNLGVYFDMRMSPSSWVRASELCGSYHAVADDHCPGITCDTCDYLHHDEGGLLQCCAGRSSSVQPWPLAHCHQRYCTSHSRPTQVRPHQTASDRPTLAACSRADSVQIVCADTLLPLWLSRKYLADLIQPVAATEMRWRLRSASSSWSYPPRDDPPLVTVLTLLLALRTNYLKHFRDCCHLFILNKFFKNLLFSTLVFREIHCEVLLMRLVLLTALCKLFKIHTYWYNVYELFVCV